MISILAYKCDVPIDDKFYPAGIKVEKITELEVKSTYKHEVLIWSNNYIFGSQQLKLFPNLKAFINWGVNDINIQTYRQFAKRGIIIKRIDYYCTETLAEYVLVLILMFERKLDLLIANQKIAGGEIYGEKVGIIGLGKIGFRLAQIFKISFDCQIYYYSRKNKLLDSFKYVNVKKIFQLCNYVILTIRSDDFHIDEKLLLLANKNLIIVNISNDSILPLRKILPFIKSGKIKGYIGDLFETGVGKNELTENIILINKYGYLTTEAKTIRHNILLTYLKRITSFKNDRNNIYLIQSRQTRGDKAGVFQGNLDSPLTKLGINQAQKIAQFLKNKQIMHIFSSPQIQAKKTAEIISSEIKAKVIIIPALREMSLGIFQGKRQATIKELFKDFFIKREKNKFYRLYERYPEGESYFDVFLRTLKSLTDILGHYDNFIIVGHEKINQAIAGIIKELPLEEIILQKQEKNSIIRINFHTLEEAIINLN